MNAAPVAPQKFRRRMTPEEQDKADKQVLQLVKSGVTSPEEISRAFGYSDRTWGWRALKRLVGKGLLSKNSSTGRIQKTEQIKNAEESIDVSRDSFMQIPSVALWVEDLRTRKDGKPIKTWRSRVWALQVVCETLKISPDSIVCEMVNPESTTSELMTKKQTVEYWLRKFALKFAEKSSANIRGHVTAVVDFGASQKGLAIMRNVSGILSRKKVGYGNYAHVKLTEEQINEIPNICEREGDLVLRDVFELGIATGTREKALLTAKVSDFEINEDHIVVRVHESKTEGHGTSNWEKTIIDPKTIMHLKTRIQERKALGKELLFFDSSFDAFEREMRTKIKLLYRKVGVTEPYFFAHSIHALRHAAAQHWLLITNYEYKFVADLLGWKTTEVLEQSYGKMPASVRMAKLRAFIAKASQDEGAKIIVS